MDIRQSALAYARRGWHVLPLNWITEEGSCSCGNPSCKSQGKHPYTPLTPHGLKEATKDLPMIRRWFRQYPKLNIGIRTGAVSGLVVVDLDGDDGLISWAGYDRDEHRHDPTLLAITGSGGLHYFFQHPGFHVPNSAGKIGEGVDIRGDDGYVVAAPSTHKSGDRYQWDGEGHPERREAAPPPRWLLPRLVAPTKAPERVAPTELRLPDQPRVIREGERNVSFASIAGSLRRQGADEEHIRDYLERMNNAISSPLPEREVASVARSISRYEPGRRVA